LLFRTGESGKQQRKGASPLSIIDHSGMPLRDAIKIHRVTITKL